MKLIQQFLKFSVVGILCFLIEFAVLAALEFLFGDTLYLLFSGIAFAISVAVNYLLSMRYVFHGKETMRRSVEVLIYVFLSVLGLLINLLIMWLCKASFSPLPGWISALLTGTYLEPKILEYTTLVSKVIATAVVFLWNFTTRKLFLEQKPDKSR